LGGRLTLTIEVPAGCSLAVVDLAEYRNREDGRGADECEDTRVDGLRHAEPALGQAQ
jgi:hypothetical protein